MGIQTPIKISNEAVRSLSVYMRAWSGWRDSHVVFDPDSEAVAMCDHVTHQFTINPERLILNPNRVLLTVSPFRLKQEAVLTGAMLHEAAHARHSRWLPRTEEGVAALRHADDSPVTNQQIWLARLMEEARIEGLMYGETRHVGALGLGWTLLASAAHVVPPTTVSTDPDQQTLDVLQSWALRSGRRVALQQHKVPVPAWADRLTYFTRGQLIRHFETAGDSPTDAGSKAARVLSILARMASHDDDTGMTMLGLAKDALDIMFPETGGPERTVNMCVSAAAPDESEGDDESEGEESEGAGSGEGDGDEESEGAGSGEGESEGDGDGDGDGEAAASAAKAELEAALKSLEDASKVGAEDVAEAEEKRVAPVQSRGSSGSGTSSSTFRMPDKGDRNIARSAERFLRSLIDPSESSKRFLSESPSATVDGSAMAAWKAGGQVREPRFFQRTRRSVEPTPPVKIAVLVDVSGSMDILQEPSAVLSWALASAAQDMANFAGRGRQIEATMIHWGNTARVMQANGENLPGVHTSRGCWEGTYAMNDALRLVEEQIPGFFDPTEDGSPENRLLVQFTDWGLSSSMHRDLATTYLSRALASGVNMLSVVPETYADRWSDLPEMLRQCKEQRGKSTVVKYDPRHPDGVWDAAAKALG